MNKDELIVKQSLELANLKEKLIQYEEAAKSIHNEIFCIDGPLNDNIQQYTKKQMFIFFRIIDHIEFSEWK
ncbi:hypothetical protein KAR91_48355 [Candidatus Pacearchaeota archaeon]|nr:hypothetical protein [Candidatus Pacearchaeota archaeon]